MKLNKLSAVFAKNHKQPGMHNDGGGLYLKITQNGSKSWIFRYRDRATGKLRDMGLGSAQSITLSQARDLSAAQRIILNESKDPISERKRDREKRRASSLKTITFEQAAKLYYEKKAIEFRSEKHRNDWINSLTHHAIPTLGNLSTSEIELSHVAKTLQPIWNDKTETATRVRQRIESVLSWATVSGHRQGENPARWKDNLEHILPKPSKIKRVKHHPALPWQQMHSFMSKLQQRSGLAPRALEFAILTAARSGEVRLATWDEIDLNTKTWTIPANRMKAGLSHKVPLSESVITLLISLPKCEGSNYVFPAPKGGPLSDMTLSAVCRRMKVNAVPHGFRSSFKDWARNQTDYSDEVSELALAHVNSDSTRAAYARDELLPKRAKMMSDWAKFCNTSPASGDVVPMKATRVPH